MKEHRIRDFRAYLLPTTQLLRQRKYAISSSPRLGLLLAHSWRWCVSLGSTKAGQTGRTGRHPEAAEEGTALVLAAEAIKLSL